MHLAIHFRLSLLCLLRLSLSYPVQPTSQLGAGSVYPRDGIDFPVPRITPPLVLEYFPRPFGEIPRNLSLEELNPFFAAALATLDSLIIEHGPETNFELEKFEPMGGVFWYNDIFLRLTLHDPREGEVVANKLELIQGESIVLGMQEALKEKGWREETRIVTRLEERGAKRILAGVDLVYKKQRQGLEGTGEEEIVVLKK